MATVKYVEDKHRRINDSLWQIGRNHIVLAKYICIFIQS